MIDLPTLDKRPLVGEYVKTILLLTGPSNIGKSTLTELLLNNNFTYLSIDSICKKAELPIIQEFINLKGKEIDLNLGLLFKFIREECSESFIDHFFNKYIKENSSLNIFIEGYLFMLADIYQLFIIKCKEYNYRLWNIRRTL
jgi:GTPase SAR1 family protein